MAALSSTKPSGFSLNLSVNESVGGLRKQVPIDQSTFMTYNPSEFTAKLTAVPQDDLGPGFVEKPFVGSIQTGFSVEGLDITRCLSNRSFVELSTTCVAKSKLGADQLGKFDLRFPTRPLALSLIRDLAQITKLGVDFSSARLSELNAEFSVMQADVKKTSDPTQEFTLSYTDSFVEKLEGDQEVHSQPILYEKVKQACSLFALKE